MSNNIIAEMSINTLTCNFLNNKRASLACAARLADTLCPPEAPFGRLESHWLIIREISSLNMSILVLKSISLEKSPNLSILMRNDDVITK